VSKINWETLQPGFLIGYFDPDSPPDEDFLVILDWKEHQKDYWGGLVLPNTLKLETLNDEKLKELGLQRIPQ